MGKETITTASTLLAMWDGWQEAILEDDYAAALAVVHDMVKKATRIDSATMGFAAGLYYGKRRERDRRRMKAKKKPGLLLTATGLSDKPLTKSTRRGCL